MANGKRAIVIGASTGIGRATAKVLANNGYSIGLVARREELLRQLQAEIPGLSFVKRIDIGQPEKAMELLRQLIKEMGGLDLIVLNAAINNYNTSLDWPGEVETINVNISGFVAMANVAVKHFQAQNSRHVVGVSSIAALRGSVNCTAYNASKAFIHNYLEGLQYKLKSQNIFVTDICPGLVDTYLVRGFPTKFLKARPEIAAEQIWQAIKSKKKLAYVPKQWLIVVWLVKFLPDWVYGLRYKNRNPWAAIGDDGG